jgi:hypothetical protein
MSGSGDDSVKITITGDASGFGDATERAATAATALASSLTNAGATLTSLGTKFQAAGSDVTQLAIAMAQSGASAQQIASTFNLSATQAQAMASVMAAATSNTRGMADQLIGAANAALRSKDQFAAAAAAMGDASNRSQALASNLASTNTVLVSTGTGLIKAGTEVNNLAVAMAAGGVSAKGIATQLGLTSTAAVQMAGAMSASGQRAAAALTEANAKTAEQAAMLGRVNAEIGGLGPKLATAFEAEAAEADKAARAAANLAAATADGGNKTSEAEARWRASLNTLSAFKEQLQAAGNNIRKMNPDLLLAGQNSTVMGGALGSSRDAAEGLSAGVRALGSSIAATAPPALTLKAAMAELDAAIRADNAAVDAFKAAQASATGVTDAHIEALTATTEAMIKAKAGVDQAGAAFQAAAMQFGTTGNALHTVGESAQFFLDVMRPSPLQAFNALMSENAETAAKMTAQLQALNRAETELAGGMSQEEAAALANAEAMNASGEAAEKLSQSLRLSDIATVQQSASFQAMQRAAIPLAQFIYADASAAEELSQKLENMRARVYAASVDQRSLAQGFILATDAAKLSDAEYARLSASIRALAAAGEVETRTLKDNILAANGFNNAMKSAEESAHLFAQALGDVQTPAQQLKTLMNTDLPEGAAKTQHGMTGVYRELLVIGHEAMTGNFSRIPGSLITMADRSGFLTGKLVELASQFTVMQGIALGALAAVTAAIGVMIARAIEAANSIRQIGNAAVLLGQDTARARAEAAGMNDQLKGIGVGQTEALKVAGGIETVTSATAAQKSALADLAVAFAKSIGETPEKATEKLVSALNHGASGVQSLITEYKLWDAQTGLVQRSQLKLAEDTHDSAASTGIAIDALSKRYPELLAKIKEFRAAGNTDMEFQAGPMQEMKLPDAPQRAESPEVAKQRDETVKYNAELNKSLALQDALKGAQAQYAAAGSEAERRIAAEAEHNIQVQIQLQRRMGDSSWVQEQEAALNEILVKAAAHATTRKGMVEAENRASVTFWEAASKQINLTEGEMNAALSALSHARIQLRGEELTDAAAAAKQALADKLAALSEEQAANHDDYQKVMQIEQEKLALIKAAHGASSKSYESELAKQDTMRRTHAAKMASDEEHDLAVQTSEDDKALAALKSSLDAQVAAQQITKSKELAIIRQFTADARQSEIEGYTALLATLGQQPEKYREVQDKITQIKAQALAEQAKMDAQAAEEEKQRWDKAVAPVESAVSGQLAAWMHGQETMGQALNKMLANAVTSYAEMALQGALKVAAGKAYEVLITGTAETQKTGIVASGSVARDAIATTETARENTGVLARLGRWIFGESAKTASTATGSAQRSAIATTETARDNAGVLLRISRWLFGESAKTASSATGAAARNTISGTETATENAGLLVRLGRWIATQLGMTGAAVGGAGARKTVLTTEQATAVATTGLAARLNIGAAAAVAGAWAFADSAQLGPPGLAAAPGAATAAYATTMGYQTLVPSLDVGAWNVPKDMGANLHAGEMVVPTNFAEGMRGALGGGGAGAQQTLNYAPQISSGGGSEVAGMLRQQSAQFKSYLWHATRNGALNLPHGR